MARRPYLSVVVPAYNEEGWIERCVVRLATYFRKQGRPFELIIVNDGSRDRTAAEARRAIRRIPRARVISYAANRGKGHAIRRGVLASRGAYVLFLDADLSTDPREWPKLRARLNERTPIVIGSRKMAGARLKRRQPWWRESMGKVFTWLVCITLADASDVTCGFKVFRGDVARSLFALQRMDDWSFDAEILFLARRRGLAIAEAPVVWADNTNSKVRIVSATLGALWGILRIRWNAIVGAYDH